MTKKTYSEKLKDPRWQKKRLEIFQRDGWACRLCGESEITLHVHHDSYKGNPWDINSKELKTVCKFCHEIIHDVKKSENASVVHIEKPISTTDYEYEVYIVGPSQNGVAFYKITAGGGVMFTSGFYKSAIDRFNTILNSL